MLLENKNASDHARTITASALNITCGTVVG
jgi:hypothetical protein